MMLRRLAAWLFVYAPWLALWVLLCAWLPFWQAIVVALLSAVVEGWERGCANVISRPRPSSRKVGGDHDE